MKKLVLIIGLLFISHQSFSLAISEVHPTQISMYNFSPSTFSIAGFQLTVNATVYEINNLTIISGTLNTPAGATVILGGITVPNGPASIGLWYGGTFPGTPTSSQLASFMQYGAAAQLYEALAVTAFLWSANTFVAGLPPFKRNGDYTTWGAGNWTSTLAMEELGFQLIMKSQPNPFRHRLNVEMNTGKIESVKLYNLLGQEIMKVEAVRQREVELNTEFVKNGVYLVQVTMSDGQTFIRRVSKH